MIFILVAPKGNTAENGLEVDGQFMNLSDLSIK